MCPNDLRHLWLPTRDYILAGDVDRVHGGFFWRPQDPPVQRWVRLMFSSENGPCLLLKETQMHFPWFNVKSENIGIGQGCLFPFILNMQCSTMLKGHWSGKQWCIPQKNFWRDYSNCQELLAARKHPSSQPKAPQLGIHLHTSPHFSFSIDPQQRASCWRKATATIFLLSGRCVLSAHVHFKELAQNQFNTAGRMNSEIRSCRDVGRAHLSCTALTCFRLITKFTVRCQILYMDHHGSYCGHPPAHARLHSRQMDTSFWVYSLHLL